MQKQAPSTGRILVAIGFALSCFALLLFLWITFGGPVPLKPASYRFTADFKEAITLSKEAEVRIGGVTVGKVKTLELVPLDECGDDPDLCNATRAEMEIDPEFAPISSDASAILRQKTLLGETYIELTTGSQVDPQEGSDVQEAAAGQSAQTSSTDVDADSISGENVAEAIPEDGHLESSQVVEQVQIDEIFNALDEETRQSFQLWMKNAGIAVDGRGLDLNDAFGNVGPFSEDASDVLGTLRRQEQALRGVVRNTGAVFEALTAREQELAGAVVGSNRTFRALASRDEALAETFQILPTFQVESRLTLERLKRFAQNARPLFRDLKPVARDISPTLRDLRRLSPNLRRLFNNLDPLIKASETGLPALQSFLDQLRPVMISLDPFLANLNPIIRYLDYYSPVVGDFLSAPSFGTSGALPPVAGQSEPRHISRQMGIFTAETLSVHPNRLRTNRGNGYLMPFALGNAFGAAQDSVIPDYDCQNTATTGGLGSGQVSTNPASTPPVQEGTYPASVATAPILPPPLGGPGGILPPIPTPATSAFAPCILQTEAMGNFPAEFGGGRQPQVLADP